MKQKRKDTERVKAARRITRKMSEFLIFGRHLDDGELYIHSAFDPQARVIVLYGDSASQGMTMRAVGFDTDRQVAMALAVMGQELLDRRQRIPIKEPDDLPVEIDPVTGVISMVKEETGQ